MTKRDFEALANALAKERKHHGWTVNKEGYGIGWMACVSAVADVCAAFNPRFDRDKFVRACNER